MINKGWLYAFFIFLAQTCNPYYQAEYNSGIQIPDEALSMEEDIEIEPPMFEDQDIVVEEAPPPPPPPPPASDGIFKIVEEMPRFPGCEQKAVGRDELNRCAQKAMMDYIAQNVKYPKIARENGIEGRAIVQFVVKKDGRVDKVKVLRDPGGGCGAEAERVVKSMPKWIPGKQRGKAVNVQFTLPVNFRIPEEKPQKAPAPILEIEEEPVFEDEVTYKVVEDMPRFPGCEEMGLERVEVKKCAEEKMLKFVYSNLKFPTEAVKNGTEGRVILQWKVARDGSLEDIKILKDIGDGCGQAAVDIIKKMPKWIPGKQRGRPVRVQYTFPIAFRQN